MTSTVLTVNTGSSSVKLALFEDGRVTKRARLDLPARDVSALLGEFSSARPDTVVHRVVHGGAHSSPALVDDALVGELERLSPLAPNHNPVALSWIAGSRQAWPDVPNVAVFDTSFFAGLPDAAATYALPRAFREKREIRRYGFHGLAHESMWRAYRALGRPESSRIVTLQLGSGCSAAAIAGGRALDTSMGFTPLEGLVMGTRAGDLDPGLVLFLVRDWGLEAVEHALSKESGLRGLSGQSGDVRELDERGGAAAELALDVFVHRARKYVGAYLAVLEGADAIVLGGGIAEHSAALRARVLSGFEYCGARLDADVNARASGEMARLHAAESRVELYLARVDEERILLERARGVVNEIR